MIRTGDKYRASLQDGREVYISGERVKDVTTHPMFKPLVDIRARIYDMQHDAATREVTRVGDEIVGEMWSLFDGQDVLHEVDPQFSENIKRHVDKVLYEDPFHVSANTDPKGDRSRPPQEQDPDMLLYVVKETDTGIVVRGAKFETAAAVKA